MYVRPKKSLGQHFMRDASICQRIADEIKCDHIFSQVLEVGPGTGALTKFLLQAKNYKTSVVELDGESVRYLEQHFPQLENRIFSADFLNTPLENFIAEGSFAVVGNFPYYISSQILFRVLDYRNRVPLVVGMFQKELAQRIASPPGPKEYGIISVLMQAFYKVEYLFTVDEDVFVPPPKVKSAVIRLIRNEIQQLACDEVDFKLIVKTSFNQRRKTLRNSLKSLIDSKQWRSIPDEIASRRPETLSMDEFVALTQHLVSA